MEVEFGTPSSPSAAGSRHGSPFVSTHAVVGGSGGTTNSIFMSAVSSSTASTSAAPSRKRQRSIHQYHASGSGSEYGSPDVTTSYFFAQQETSEDEYSPAKRHNTFGSRGRDGTEEHHFSSLGQAAPEVQSETDDYHFSAAITRGVNGEYEASDNGMDSPMHSLSLVSPSESIDGKMSTRQQQREAAEDDVDMTASGSGGMQMASPETSLDARLQESTSSSTSTLVTPGGMASSSRSFVPRQVRARLSQHENAPIRPSPLTQAQSEDSFSASSDSPQQRSMDTSAHSSPRLSLHSMRRSATEPRLDAMDVHDARPPSNRMPAIVDRDHIPSFRRMSRSERAIRTPSPRPQSFPSEYHGNLGGRDDDDDDESLEEGRDGQRTDGDKRRHSTLHPSPGLAGHSSYFPGGRQMLRYTMGFRDDCDLCRDKVPGHYGHVVHRSS